MSARQEIDYGELIDRLIKDFRPAQRLWPTSARLVCWILFEAAILALAVVFRGYSNLPQLPHNSGQLMGAALFLFTSIAAAFLALKSAIPGRELTWPQMGTAIALVAAACAFEPGGRPSEIFETTPTLMLQVFGLAALPALSLFWAVRRGVPLQPEVTGAAVGLTAFSLAAALYLIIAGPARVAGSGASLALSCTVVLMLSALAGRLVLNWIARWQVEGVAAGLSTRNWAAFSSPALFPLAFSAATAVFIFVLRSAGPPFAIVPEFDLAIESYERAVESFHPNVPSASMETMLTAYIEHGMPAYMWDFRAEGFKLVGGRWEPLPDGTPLTYTWFRGAKGGVMCIFKETEAFNPPGMTHDEHHHLLFYRYRDFSLCLINVGGYGNFISVIAAPMPLKQFEHLVLTVML